jgi:undecaprenyl diphosphate synthase
LKSETPDKSDAIQPPVHVAVIMDGNGRWAKKRMLNRVQGHEKGADAVRMIVRVCREIGIKYLTLYAFSTENWQRPKLEISALMELLKRFLASEKQEMVENNIRLNVIGEIHRLPADVSARIHQTMEQSASNDGMQLNLALSYGGRSEIAMACAEIARKVKNGDAGIDQITPEFFEQHLYTSGMPDPELLIRTGGDYRVSNFLLWQIAYSELFITSTLWPDFTRDEFMGILSEYRCRERRFGRVFD